ncbi:hypothetical protein HNV12_00630 [Methanococcoides sp. SA1]|nr:hypothetical protein [Methanococcoides sp. SA1]
MGERKAVRVKKFCFDLKSDLGRMVWSEGYDGLLDVIKYGIGFEVDVKKSSEAVSCVVPPYGCQVVSVPLFEGSGIGYEGCVLKIENEEDSGHLSLTPIRNPHGEVQRLEAHLHLSSGDYGVLDKIKNQLKEHYDAS